MSVMGAYPKTRGLRPGIVIPQSEQEALHDIGDVDSYLAGRNAERERCTRIAEAENRKPKEYRGQGTVSQDSFVEGWRNSAKEIAAKIRSGE